MDYRVLGRTGLKVSTLGLGTGTRFGNAREHSQSAATQLVRTALDLGINYIDTAATYLSAEAMLGEALAGVPRERFVLATKFFPADEAGVPITPAELRTSVERSLKNLRLETVDVLQVHGLRPHWHQPVMAALGGELERLQQAGKFRFLGVAETILADPRHEMLPLAVPTGRFAQALVAYNLLSPWAGQQALPACAAHGVGVVGMVAVRRALHDRALLSRLVREAQTRGEIGVAELDPAAPLDWLLDAHTPTLAAAGYRFALTHPAVASVLSGTLKVEHLKANVAAVTAPPLPPSHLERLHALFSRTDPLKWVPYDL